MISISDTAQSTFKHLQFFIKILKSKIIFLTRCQCN